MTPSNISVNKTTRKLSQFNNGYEPGCMTNSHLLEMNMKNKSSNNTQ